MTNLKGKPMKYEFIFSMERVGVVIVEYIHINIDENIKEIDNIRIDKINDIVVRKLISGFEKEKSSVFSNAIIRKQFQSNAYTKLFLSINRINDIIIESVAPIKLKEKVPESFEISFKDSNFTKLYKFLGQNGLKVTPIKWCGDFFMINFGEKAMIYYLRCGDLMKQTFSGGERSEIKLFTNFLDIPNDELPVEFQTILRGVE